MSKKTTIVKTADYTSPWQPSESECSYLWAHWGGGGAAAATAEGGGRASGDGPLPGRPSLETLHPPVHRERGQGRDILYLLIWSSTKDHYH